VTSQRDPLQVWTVLLAAGSGSRFGGETPKQYEQLGGRRVLDWSIDAAREVGGGVVLVVGADRLDDPEPGVDRVVAGGSTRSESVRAGLSAVPRDAQIIVVHDSARPLAGAALFGAVVAAVGPGVDGAIPGVAVTDTVKRVADGSVVETLEREDLVAVQTPQAFRAGVLRRAHAQGQDATDDAALVEGLGGTVVVVPGLLQNVKITHPHDLDAAAQHLQPDQPPG
jgi:2-C-methyl-D-erythritol 4-phosphate cytidylyltransferase